jgi:NAD(P)H-hydrate epimerase
LRRLPRREDGVARRLRALTRAAKVHDERLVGGGGGHLESERQAVVAGTPDRPGAALLAARAARRAGAGLVTLASDRETVARVAPVLDELCGLSLGEAMTVGSIIKALETRTALAIGPSLEPGRALSALVRAVLEEAAVPVVVDAGAVVSLGPDLGWLKGRTYPTVLTPHPGEMGTIVGLSSAAVQRDRLAVARAVSDRSGACVILKGASTVVASPDGSVDIIMAGNAGMATGGSGDVLTGIVGALLARGVDARTAAGAGALVHARAGDRALARIGSTGLVASDLIGTLPEVIAGP